jgi:zinc transport system substrate-binding protein
LHNLPRAITIGNMNRTRFVAAIAIVLFLAGIAILLGTRTAAPSDRMQVVATFYPLYEFAKQVGGTRVEVTNITPAGSEPHDYEPTPQQMAAAQKAGVFIYNGAPFEPWMAKFLPEYKGTKVAGGSNLEIRTGYDPHYWLDPVFAQTVVNNIRDALGRADPANSQYYTQQSAVYNAKLQKLHDDITAGLRECKLRTVITSHDAFGYYGARYNLKIVPIAGISPDQEPSPAKLAELSDLVKQEGIGYVFFESLVSPKLAETVAAEAGAKTAVFDTIEGITSEEQQKGKDYIAVQRENLQNLRTALACR